ATGRANGAYRARAAPNGGRGSAARGAIARCAAAPGPLYRLTPLRLPQAAQADVLPQVRQAPRRAAAGRRGRRLGPRNDEILVRRRASLAPGRPHRGAAGWG